MDDKKKILIITTGHASKSKPDNVKILEEHFKVDYLLKSTKEEIMQVPDWCIDYRYRLKWAGTLNKFCNYIFTAIDISRLINKNNYDLVIMNGMPRERDMFLPLYKLLIKSKTKIYIQLCTPLGNSKLLKTLFSWILKQFKYVAGDTPLLRQELKLENRKYLFRGSIGYSDNYGFKKRDFSSIKLVYIGVHRSGLEKTIEGLSIFKEKHPNVNISYDIIGGASQNDAHTMRSTIDKHKLGNIVKYHGFLDLENVQAIFDQCNVGVSFVPMFKMYEGVSITKTIEYQLSGMPVIGTDLSFNKTHIDENSGVIHNDTAEGFAGALEIIYTNKDSYDSFAIRENKGHLLMKNVINNDIVPLYMKIINGEL